MAESITPGQIRQNNRLQVFHLIYNRRLISAREICEELHLSRPTVTWCIDSLLEDHLILESGPMLSAQVGRKAAGYSVNADHRIAIGVEITENSFHVLAINLYGEVICESEYTIIYQRSSDIHRRISDRILAFLDQNHLLKSRILGIGFSMPGLISPDGQRVFYGELLHNTGFDIREIAEHIGLPCNLLSSSNCDAVFSMSDRTTPENGFYLSLSRHISGALINGGVVESGLHGHGADIAHIPLKSGGTKCYCGKYGCLETVCSIDSLLQDSETLEDFFGGLRNNSPEFLRRWNTYLSGLAKAIHLLHLINDTVFILGGELSVYLKEADLELLYSEIEKQMLYPEERDYLQISRSPAHRTAAGAALPYVWSFLGRQDL